MRFRTYCWLTVLRTYQPARSGDGWDRRFRALQWLQNRCSADQHQIDQDYAESLATAELSPIPWVKLAVAAALSAHDSIVRESLTKRAIEEIRRAGLGSDLPRRPGGHVYVELPSRLVAGVNPSALPVACIARDPAGFSIHETTAWLDRQYELEREMFNPYLGEPHRRLEVHVPRPADFIHVDLEVGPPANAGYRDLPDSTLLSYSDRDMAVTFAHAAASRHQGDSGEFISRSDLAEAMVQREMSESLQTFVGLAAASVYEFEDENGRRFFALADGRFVDAVTGEEFSPTARALSDAPLSTMALDWGDRGHAGEWGPGLAQRTWQDMYLRLLMEPMRVPEELYRSGVRHTFEDESPRVPPPAPPQ